MISFWSFTIFADGKYFARIFCASSSHVIVIPGTREFYHSLALSFNENENNLRQMMSSIMSLALSFNENENNFRQMMSSIIPVCLKVSQISL